MSQTPAAERSTPASPERAKASRSLAIRSSIADSLRACGLISASTIDREDLRRRITIPEYLRKAMKDAATQKTPVATARKSFPLKEIGQGIPEAPIVVFVNSKSGGRRGLEIGERLRELMGEEQIFHLSHVNPIEFVHFSLAVLEQLAELGDNCARGVRQKLRVVVAGGDGTVGWVLGSLGELFELGGPVPPVAIIPLGTGNDLSRSFGWGGSFPFAWRSAVKRSLHKATNGPICHLDSWHVLVSMPVGEKLELPLSLRNMGECTLSEDITSEVTVPEKNLCVEGVFYNYFSIGMDAQVAYGFHHLRNTKPYIAQGPISNKLIYAGYSCTQGWFCTPCVGSPGLRGLKNILRLHIKRFILSDWEQIPVPSDVRSLVALNLHNYGSGRNPWGHPEPAYLEKKHFAEARADDGLLEIFGLKQGWHASFVMVELIDAKHIAQAAAIRLEIRGGEWKNAYMQMDGEPWKQAINNEFSTIIDIKRVPHHSLIISGE
ncbi:uncharacterized protein A4U43_C01F34520 [Asparagus officinalis]|uniref:Diacylglycerol kinase n=1 Tax=Asparagus officinalis TaxID=4686 RepID=A0A5P1FV90_ASPOF|nr:diacylglycerol kinase 4-like [Asparagus officinalis]ONK81944.1 uncharacterized protein A4U43_C01F34520 [Asparagus officinalis]